MAASEAAGEKNWEMERASDKFHPPTTASRSDARFHTGTVRAAVESQRTLSYEVLHFHVMAATLSIHFIIISITLRVHEHAMIKSFSLKLFVTATRSTSHN